MHLRLALALAFMAMAEADNLAAANIRRRMRAGVSRGVSTGIGYILEPDLDRVMAGVTSVGVDLLGDGS